MWLIGHKPPILGTRGREVAVELVYKPLKTAAQFALRQDGLEREIEGSSYNRSVWRIALLADGLDVLAEHLSGACDVLYLCRWHAHTKVRA